MLHARSFLLVVLCALTVLACQPASSQETAAPPITLVIHGGAGTILRSNMTPESEAAYRAKLEEALRAGYAVLADGGASLDAVVTAITVLEDSPLFNAGKGAVFTHDGTVELDASIMDGATHGAGAVAGVKRIQSPIALARAVMTSSPHVMMVGEGAEAFGRAQGFEMIENSYFFTDRRRQQLERLLQAEREGAMGTIRVSEDDLDHKFGTVGAVALDRAGNLAAGTSTGGMTNKRYGRVGDAPIIGAGTFADNATCAISATGHGEYFIRGVVAHDIAAMMEYGGKSLAEASRAVIMDKLTERGGTGGVIAVDAQGNIAMPFNTEGMYRGAIDAEGNVTVLIYKD